MKATPGPWTYEPQDGTPGHCLCAQVFGPDGNSIATVDPSQPDESEANANARLMAAAPDMLTALKVLVNDSMFKDHPAASQMAIDAIAKAETRN